MKVKLPAPACLFSHALGLILLGTMGAARAEMVVDLKTGVVTETFAATTPAPQSGTGVYNTTDGYARATVVKKGGTSCTTTGYEALVEVNLAPPNAGPLSRLSVTVEYEGTPSGWTTHIGDDPTNNGYGGGIGLQGAAETHVINQTLYVYSTGLAPGVVERMLESPLRLTEGALHFNVTNQKLTSGQPYTILETPHTKQLFDLSGSSADKKLYIGLNRVINGQATRTGCGARRVVIAWEQ